MPIEGSDDKGDLFLTFEIEFPAQFQLATKQCLINALQRNEEQIASN